MHPDSSIPVPPVPPPAEPQIAAPAPAPKLPAQPEKLLMAPRRTSWGALIGVIIILVVLVVGALYFWGAKLAEREAALPNSDIRATAESPASE